jgi:hypothetical protein
MLTLMALAGLALIVPAVTAEPPAGATCVGNYNPDALSNVCYTTNPGTPAGTGHTGTVVTDDTEVCPIGNTCETVPVPGYSSSGGVAYPTPGTPSHPQGVYIELLGHDTQYYGDFVQPFLDCRYEPNPATNKVDCIVSQL